MIQSYPDAVNLLRMIAMQDPQVGSFYVGDDGRITQATRSDISWPVVWLEYADGIVRHEQVGMVQVDYQCKLYILGGVVTDDEPEQEKELFLTEQIVKLILLRLRDLHYKKQIRFFIEGTKWQRIEMRTPDNAWGWEISFRIGDFQDKMCVGDGGNLAVATLCVEGSEGNELTLGLSTGEGGAGSFNSAVFGSMFDLGGSGASFSYSVDYDGSGGEALIKAIYQLSRAINDDPSRIVNAEPYGEYLFLRAIAADTKISIDITQGDYSWTKKFEF